MRRECRGQGGRLAGLRQLRQRQAEEIERSARLGTGARKPVAAEGLHADHRADHVAVHIDIAGVDRARGGGDGLVDAGVDAEGQPVAGRIHIIEQRRQLAAGKAQDMENRAEHLVIDISNGADLDQRGRHERAGFGLGRQVQGMDRETTFRHGADMGEQLVARLGADDRADIGRKTIRPADRKLRHRALEHGDGAVRDILLDAENSQRRAALAGAVEGGLDHIGRHLFGQR